MDVGDPKDVVPWRTAEFPVWLYATPPPHLSPRGAYAYLVSTDQPENIHGLGLPEFITPGPPPGQPLLNADENQNLDNFFHDFDSNAIAANKPEHHAQYNFTHGHPQYYNMPPMFVGSDTGLAHRSGMDPHQAPGFPYANNMMNDHDLALLGHSTNINGAMHTAQYANASFPDPLLAQLQTAATMQPTYHQTWPQPFPQPNAMNVPMHGRTGVQYGTDFRFQPTGYAAPNVPSDPDMIHPLHPMDILEPASGSTTQPNTQPNTQPSSPIWTTKRTFEEFQQEAPSRNGFAPLLKTHLPGPSQSSVSGPSPRKRKSVVKTEPGRTSQPPTPSSNSKPHTPLTSSVRPQPESTDHDDDAEAEEDADATAEQPRSPSPAPWPSSKARPPRVHPPPPPPKPPRKKKSSTSSATPAKSKSKSQRTTNPGAQPTQSSRVPLSLAQKKANHTNSEQRRRDATARSYAELYDLVPELEDQGKQSTMKKLELVVAKVRTTMQRVEELRAKLGIDPATGRQIAPPGGSNLLHSDMEGWQQ